jgi:hypothetical protein
MVGSESEFLVRIRILQKNSDYFGFGFGSTTLAAAIAEMKISPQILIETSLTYFLNFTVQIG